MKAYLCCLLLLKPLGNRGLAMLPVGKAEEYYHAVLQSAHPGDVHVPGGSRRAGAKPATAGPASGGICSVEKRAEHDVDQDVDEGGSSDAVTGWEDPQPEHDSHDGSSVEAPSQL